jgi:hypothetical protein
MPGDVRAVPVEGAGRGLRARGAQRQGLQPAKRVRCVCAFHERRDGRKEGNGLGDDRAAGKGARAQFVVAVTRRV